MIFLQNLVLVVGLSRFHIMAWTYRSRLKATKKMYITPRIEARVERVMRVCLRELSECLRIPSAAADNTHHMKRSRYVEAGNKNSYMKKFKCFYKA